MGEVVDISSRRSELWANTRAVCAGCRSAFVIIVPWPCSRADQAELECDCCGERGGVVVPTSELVNAYVAYDAFTLPPRREDVEPA